MWGLRSILPMDRAIPVTPRRGASAHKRVCSDQPFEAGELTNASLSPEAAFKLTNIPRGMLGLALSTFHG